jgi:broad specificity phosphatase PhoE
MKTTLYLIRQADLPHGVRQAEMTRDFLAVRAIDHCYCGPHSFAVQTAAILASPHGLTPQVLPALNADRAPFAELQRRVTTALEELLEWHTGQALLLVGHERVHRGYLATVLRLDRRQAEAVPLDRCGISVVVRDGTRTSVATLNTSFHLQGLAA